MQRFTFWKSSVVLSAAACVATMTLASPTLASAEESTRISGVGCFADPCDCNALGADYALILTGDLEGCLYAFVETAVFSASGTYVETGMEIFVDGEGAGTFVTAYRCEAKYAEIDNFDTEIFGRCQHVIVEDSGTGVFEGVGGRIDFKDDIDADSAGQNVLLVFTQAGCGPCHAIAPELNRGHESGSYQVIVVHHGEPNETQAWVEEIHARFPIVTQNDWETSKMHQVFATPYGFVIDEEGVIAAKGIVSTSAVHRLPLRRRLQARHGKR